MNNYIHRSSNSFRFASIGIGVIVLGVVLAWRAFDLHVLNKDFLQHQGDARSLRNLPMIAHRGMIMDRHGTPLAVSTPVDSVWAHPQQFDATPAQLKALAGLLEITPKQLKDIIGSRADKEFVYLKRHGTPEMARKVMALDIPGVALLREYRRYYPDGEVFAHVIGMTNIDDQGQEGLELGYDSWLRGTNGIQRVMKDRLGRVVKHIDLRKAPKPGKDITLSLDRRLQYLAYRELKSAVFAHKAKSGSAVILDVHTGEVLAMVNQPALNPNNREDYESYRSRNRALTDTFEPGSTIKPFTIAAALASGRFKINSVIDTTPGILRIGNYTIRDINNYGRLDLSGVIQKSSNVAATKMALSITPDLLYDVHRQVGFGHATESSFPGEVPGEIVRTRYQRDLERATLSYGYGLSVTALQLTRAYAILGADGYRRPVTFTVVHDEIPGQAVIDSHIARQLRGLLETVVMQGGTGTKAAVPGYLVAGKTGTVKKLGQDGYSDDKYISMFAGIAPARHPRLAMVVIIHEPRGKVYYGGEVAAPVFAQVMAGALRLLDVSPDNVLPTNTHLAYVKVRP